MIFLCAAGTFLFFAHLSAATTRCYAPDGITQADDRFLPCIGFDGVNSMCCRLNDTYPDTCLENGLCQWTSSNSLWRDYCTDKTWNSPNCLSKTICGAAAGGTDSGHNQLVLCRGGSGNTYCCGSSSDCCEGDRTFTLNSSLISFYSPTATSTVIASATTQPNNGSSSSKNIAIGAGVGVPLGLLAITMLGLGFWWGRRHARAKRGGSGAFQQIDTQTALFHQADSRPINELDSATKPDGPYELSINRSALMQTRRQQYCDETYESQYIPITSGN